MHGSIRSGIFTGVGVNRFALSHVAAEEEVERRNGGGEQESERRDAFMPRRENQGRAFARALPDEASTCLTLRLYIHSTDGLPNVRHFRSSFSSEHPKLWNEKQEKVPSNK